jgi:hypothetical protein
MVLLDRRRWRLRLFARGWVVCGIVPRCRGGSTGAPALTFLASELALLLGAFVRGL